MKLDADYTVSGKKVPVHLCLELYRILTDAFTGRLSSKFLAKPGEVTEAKVKCQLFPRTRCSDCR